MTTTGPTRATLPLTAVSNGWQYTTIYDVTGRPLVRFDLEDWGVTEENQDVLEAEQAEWTALIVRAVNCHDELVRALEAVAAWKDAVGLACPDLGGLLTAIYRAEAILARAKGTAHD